MKTHSILCLFFIGGMVFASFEIKAQTDSLDSDIIKMQALNGSAGTTDAMFSQVMAQLKPSKPDVTDEQWAALKKDVFDVEVAELNKQLIPIYKKHFTQADVQGIIAFYESPAGKKMAQQTPLITMESLQLSQSWGMNLFGKIQAYLDKNGGGLPYGIKRGE
jgi:uncharacterized protein